LARGNPLQLQGNKTASKISQVLGDLGAGSISALIMLCYAVGYGLIISSGSLERYISVGIPSVLVGVFNQSNVQTLTWGTAPTWDVLLDNEAKLEASNVLNTDETFAFISSPAAKKVMRKTPRSTNSSLFLWEGDEVMGYKGAATTQLASGSFQDFSVFGKWSELIIGLWGALEVTVDPFTLAHVHKNICHVSLLADIALKHPVAFVVSTNKASANP
jgi:hypothetical protein